GIYMQKQRFSREEFLEMFTQDVIRLSKYIPWLEEKSGADVSKYYEDGEKMAHTLSFPVYDSILLAFLNDASTTVFMEQNYQYFYTRNHIQSFVDELALIEKADIMHMDILQCILSRYVFGGMVKAYLWKDGVEHRIFVNILKKARQIVEFWSEPLIIEDEIPAEGYPEEEEFTYPEVDEADWTDEEFAAVLAGELDPNDIPRLRWEKEHGTTASGGAVATNVPEVVLPFDYEFPPVEDEDWTDEEFAAVLAGELDPNDIPKLHYERENGVVVVFASEEEIADEEETGAEAIEELTEESVEEDTIEEAIEVSEGEEPTAETVEEGSVEETTELPEEEPTEEGVEESEAETETAEPTDELIEEVVEENVTEELVEESTEQPEGEEATEEQEEEETVEELMEEPIEETKQEPVEETVEETEEETIENTIEETAEALCDDEETESEE
ncbi:MAG: hypothetical protein ACI4C0_02550, partial [Lachnospiraceae bacterium]